VSRLNIGGVLAFTLLGLYIYAVIVSLAKAIACPNGSTCTLDDSVALLLQTIGALVSAVVVSELAVTKPGDAPGTGIAAASQLSPSATRSVKTLAFVYILCWLVAGVTLVVVGISHPGVPQVNSAEKEWLGFAIASAYAYFGVSPGH
jgi:hypothetical protein